MTCDAVVSWRWTIIVLVLVCSMETRGLFTETTIKASRFAYTFDSFGFSDGGVAEISGTIEIDGVSVLEGDPRIQAYLCPDKAYTILVSDPKSEEVICPAAPSNDTRYNSTTPTASSSLTEQCKTAQLDGNVTTMTINLKDIYRFMIVNCMKTSDSTIEVAFVRVKYSAVNPGDSQLPVGTEPLPVFYLTLAISWSTVLALWGIFMFKERQRQNQLHQTITAVIVLKTAAAIISTFYWRVYSAYGLRLDELNYLRNFVFAVSETAFFACLMLVAKGWCITRGSIAITEMRSIAMALVLLLSTLLFFSFYDDTYNFLVMMIMYFFMLPKIFSSISRNYRMLESQSWVILQSNIRELDHTTLQLKIKVLKLLRTSVVGYLGGILMANSMRVVMVWFLSWMNIVANEEVSFVMVTFISWWFRPQNTSLFILLRDIPGLMHLQSLMDHAALLGNHNPEEGNIGDPIVPWDLSKTLIIEYPSKKKRRKRRIAQHVTKLPIAMAVQQDYATANAASLITSR